MSDNKRIAKNTLFLYIRMFVNMGVSLYTSRLILEALGVVDYGIYGLVGGIVTIFSFLNSSLSSATQRYLSFDIGKSNLIKLQNTFNTTLNIHILIAFVIFIIGESIGLWFVNNKLNIPVNRLSAANWVFHFSLLTFILGVIQAPYNALIVAREKMNIYAYVGILETFLKLGIALILIRTNYDQLILFSVLVFCLSLISQFFYNFYCYKNFKESVYKFYFNKKFYREILLYTGWNLFGNIAAVARNQGSNILLNLFFGPALNAAYSLTIMVQSVIGKFISNFQIAVNPQIVIKYAKGDIEGSKFLIYKSSKFSYYAMLVLIVPIIINTEFILNGWLTTVPDHSFKFIKLALIFSLIETLSNPLMKGIQATGKIKIYQAVVGGLVFLNLPLTWVLFKFTNIPQSFLWVYIAISITSLFFRLYFIQKTMKIKITSFFKEVLFKIILVSFILALVLYPLFPYLIENKNFLLFLLKTIIILIITMGIIISIGLTNSEKMFLKVSINKIFKRS